jgi:hypothetical protein
MVLVRQRALQKPRKSGLLLSGSLPRSTACGGMEPFMEPSGREASPPSAKDGHIAINSAADESRVLDHSQLTQHPQ